MADYHGDIMYRTGRIHESRDDNNYVVAIVLLLFFGAIGLHRFYLNDTRAGWLYFGPFAVSVFIGIAMLDFTLLIWNIGIASFFLFGELLYFIYRLYARSVA